MIRRVSFVTDQRMYSFLSQFGGEARPAYCNFSLMIVSSLAASAANPRIPCNLCSLSFTIIMVRSLYREYCTLYFVLSQNNVSPLRVSPRPSRPRCGASGSRPRPGGSCLRQTRLQRPRSV